MKKAFLLLALAFMATVSYSQEEEDSLQKVDGFYWQYDDAARTATVVSSYRWHKHGDEDAYGNCHCYHGDIVIPEKAPNGYTVTGVGDQAFNCCDGLTSVKLPATLKTIGDLAFQLCTKLKEINIPASMELMDYNPFGGSSLERFIIEDSDAPIVIGSAAVYGSFFLGLPVRYAYVGRNFIVSNPSAEETGGPKGLFYSCEELEEVVFGSNVTLLHEGDCSYCRKLKKVTIGAGVTTIPDYCFDTCPLLETADIPYGLVSIGKYAFSDSPKVNFLSQHYKKLKSIGQGAFMNTEATSVTIPASVEWVGDCAFGFDSKLKEIRSYAAVPPTCETWAGPVSDEMYKTCRLYVPKGSEAAYKAAEGWKQFFSTSETGEGKCATPTVSIEEGELVFACDTKDVEFHYSFTYPQNQEGAGTRVTLPQTVTLSVYASCKGKEDSDVAVYELSLASGGIYGDVNNDGIVDVADISRIILIMAGF